MGERLNIQAMGFNICWMKHNEQKLELVVLGFVPHTNLLNWIKRSQT
ncbi:hypothetical protein ABIT13_05290 [Limnospira fusiformis NRMCF6962]